MDKGVDAMNITIIHGQAHEGSTYHIARGFIENIADDNDTIFEFRVNAMKPCIGCFNCILRDESLCPHRAQLTPIVEAMDASDLIVLASPNYCMGMTGQMKSFLDHLGYRWMSHRPAKEMFQKVGLCISTSAGMGAKGVTKDLAKHMLFWGMPTIHRFHWNVSASSWSDVSSDLKLRIAKETTGLSQKIRKEVGHTHPGPKSVLLFQVMKMNQKSNTWSELDRNHWVRNGWLSGTRPWTRIPG